MGMEASRMYGMKILTNSGRILGKVEGLVIDLEAGRISRILLEKVGEVDEKDIAKKSVLYKNVLSVDEVVVVAGDKGARQSQL